MFAALADPTRRQVVRSLSRQPELTASRLAGELPMTRQAVTKHLQVLADAGLVHDLKVGRERLWQFDPEQLDEARRSLEIIGRQWERALGKLRAALEG